MNTNGDGELEADKSSVPLPSFLLELLGLSGYALVPGQCGRQDGVWVIAVTPAFVGRRCGKCGSLNVKMHTPYLRDIAHIPVGIKRTQLRIVVPRIYCKDCTQTSTPDLPGALPGHNLSVDLRDYMLDRYQSRQVFTQIAFDAGASERTTARVIKEHIQKIDEARSKVLVMAEKAGIDDIRVHRGEDGIWTHIVDLGTGETVDVLPGISEALVQYFLGGLKDVHAVNGYCSDGAAQYIAVGKTNFPDATRTLNRFHVIKYLLEGLDAVRSHATRNIDAQEPAQDSLIDDTSDQWEDYT